MFLLLYLLNVFQVLFKVKQLFKNAIQRSVLRLDSQEWQSVWDDRGKYLIPVILSGYVLLPSIGTWGKGSQVVKHS